MGRYYSGDIEGKFWFAVQNSDAADRFGAEGTEPNYLEYYFDEDHLPAIEGELKDIEDNLGEAFALFDRFFKETNGYNDEIMEKWGLPVSLWNKHKMDYADYILGVKIRDCIKENGSCSFQAEL